MYSDHGTCRVRLTRDELQGDSTHANHIMAAVPTDGHTVSVASRATLRPRAQFVGLFFYEQGRVTGVTYSYTIPL